MYRRKFMTKETPYHIEEFRNDKVTEYRIDNNTSIELVHGHYSLIFCNENYLTVNSINEKILGDFRKIALEYDKIRYYIPLTSILDAKIDICYSDQKNSSIIVDFNSKEEANNFEIPSWFGKELLPELMAKTKKKSK